MWHEKLNLNFNFLKLISLNKKAVHKERNKKMPTLELIAQIESLQKENKELKEQVADLEFITKALDGELSKYTKLERNNDIK